MKDNRLIAEFMNFKFSLEVSSNKGEYYRPLYNSGDWIPEDELQFHESWDWLMPVVETCYHNGAEEQEIGDITHALLDCDLKNLYDAVVEFIKEFNLKSQ